MGWLAKLFRIDPLQPRRVSVAERISQVVQSIEDIAQQAKSMGCSDRERHLRIASYLEGQVRESGDSAWDMTRDFLEAAANHHRELANDPELLKCESLINAAFDGQTEEVKRLLDTGIPVEGVVGGQNALHAAIENSQCETVECLLRRGADVNAVLDGVPPLHHAIDVEADHISQMQQSHRGRSLVALLLQYHADISIEDGKGRTALACARAFNHSDAVTMILEQGGGT
jgi:hypothetical protein